MMAPSACLTECRTAPYNRHDGSLSRIRRCARTGFRRQAPITVRALSRMNRLLGITLAAFWIVAMAMLIRRDILPFWQAQDPPCKLIPGGTYQIGICNEDGRRLGATWITTTVAPTCSIVRSKTILDMGKVGGFLSQARQLILKSELTYMQDGLLQEFLFQLIAAGIHGRVNGERYGRDFACHAEIGPISKTVALDGELSQYLGESLRPFTHLENLHVGQSWRIRLLDPFRLLTEERLEFNVQVATVTGRETIEHNGGQVECFRIEAEGATAWANDKGRVLRQEVTVPILGKFILTDEPFDEEASEAAFSPRERESAVKPNTTKREDTNEDG